MSESRRTVRLVVRGRVQGVGYRFATVREAVRLGISGWVRNRADGSVEALAQGTPAAIDALVEWAQRGPPASRVEDVDVSEAAGEFESFEVR
ncbi:MAG TPA: acylphosphatase, partial [Usitatibacter sp.]|nr:acylphosphatase [Usitatibacter sp.]